MISRSLTTSSSGFFQFAGVVGELLQRGARVLPGRLFSPRSRNGRASGRPAQPRLPSGPLAFAGAALRLVVVGIARLVHAEQVAQVINAYCAPPRSDSGFFCQREMVCGCHAGIFAWERRIASADF
ncbi:MAG: hypothetical protein IPL72_12440 [Sulfuritalea sp.]|nr:hypothetical protein [Sulfuritalea sp.]